MTEIKTLNNIDRPYMKTQSCLTCTESTLSSIIDTDKRGYIFKNKIK